MVAKHCLQASKTCTRPDQSTTQLVPGAENDFHAQLAACRFASASRPAPKIPDGEKGALRLGSPPSKCNPSKPRNPGASRWSSLVDGDGQPSPSGGHMHEPRCQLLSQNAEEMQRECLLLAPPAGPDRVASRDEHRRRSPGKRPRRPLRRRRHVLPCRVLDHRRPLHRGQSPEPLPSYRAVAFVRVRSPLPPE